MGKKLTPDWSGTWAPCPLKLKNSESPARAPELRLLACQRMFALVGHCDGYGLVSLGKKWFLKFFISFFFLEKQDVSDENGSRKDERKKKKELSLSILTSSNTMFSSRKPKRLTSRWRRQLASLMHPCSEAEGVAA